MGSILMKPRSKKPFIDYRSTLTLQHYFNYVKRNPFFGNYISGSYKSNIGKKDFRFHPGFHTLTILNILINIL